MFVLRQSWTKYMALNEKCLWNSPFDVTSSHKPAIYPFNCHLAFESVFSRHTWLNRITFSMYILSVWRKTINKYSRSNIFCPWLSERHFEKGLTKVIKFTPAKCLKTDKNTPWTLFSQLRQNFPLFRLIQDTDIQRNAQ